MRVDAREIVSGYGAGPVVNSVDVAVAEGQILAIVGRNGMGKSTLIKTLLGYVPLAGGSISMNGRSISGMGPAKIVREHRAAYAPQEAGLFANLSVRDNLYGKQRRSAIDRDLETFLFEQFPVLPKRLGQRAGTMSGGEQKQLLLSRAILQKPNALFLDEISAGLQPSIVNTVIGVLKKIHASSHPSIVMVEQNIDLCLAIAETTIVMKRGQIIAEISSDVLNARKCLLEYLAP